MAGQQDNSGPAGVVDNWHGGVPVGAYAIDIERDDGAGVEPNMNRFNVGLLNAGIHPGAAPRNAAEAADAPVARGRGQGAGNAAQGPRRNNAGRGGRQARGGNGGRDLGPQGDRRDDHARGARGGRRQRGPNRGANRNVQVANALGGMAALLDGARDAQGAIRGVDEVVDALGAEVNAVRDHKRDGTDPTAPVGSNDGEHGNFRDALPFYAGGDSDYKRAPQPGRPPITMNSTLVNRINAGEFDTVVSRVSPAVWLLVCALLFFFLAGASLIWFLAWWVWDGAYIVFCACCCLAMILATLFFSLVKMLHTRRPWRTLGAPISNRFDDIFAVAGGWNSRLGMPVRPLSPLVQVNVVQAPGFTGTAFQRFGAYFQDFTCVYTSLKRMLWRTAVREFVVVLDGVVDVSTDDDQVSVDMRPVHIKSGATVVRPDHNICAICMSGVLSFRIVPSVLFFSLHSKVSSRGKSVVDRTLIETYVNQDMKEYNIPMVVYGGVARAIYYLVERVLFLEGFW